MQPPITLQSVLATRDQLPAFPRVVLQILESLEDPAVSLALLSEQIESDPVLAARVLSLANRAANPVRAPVQSVFTALSLVGVARVRELALTLRLAGFMEALTPLHTLEHFWGHSLACAVSGVEIAHYTPAEVSAETALIACLLHDVGELWLQRFAAPGLQQARDLARRQSMPSDVAEREILGVDHGMVGSWLASSWGLAKNICNSIEHHHNPEARPPDPLLALVHVAEVLGNALNLANLPDSRVIHVSARSCAQLGLDWGPDSQALFGRIEARSRHAFALFQPLPPSAQA